VIDKDRQLKNSVVSWPVYVEDRVPDSRLTARRLDPNRVDGSYIRTFRNYNGISRVRPKCGEGSNLILLGYYMLMTAKLYLA